MAAITASTSPFLSQPWLASRCHSVSGACTTPMSRPATTSRKYSGRVGGSPKAGCTTARVLAMRDHLLLLDAIGKQNFVDAVGQLAAGGWVYGIVAAAVELALDLTRMRREQQDAVADQHRLRNRVG